MCAGVYEDVEEVLNRHGRSLDDLETIEDAALGNGGLGRLAACFLDSAATLDLPLDGYGIRYKYGLFKQRIVDGFQKEEADNWTKYGDPWSVRCQQDAVDIKYADMTVRAVPYDMPIIGYGTDNVGNLRL
jgi:starch phosphorylase